MRSAPASIQAMLATSQLTLAHCVKFILRDGTEIGFTDHDRNLVVPLASDLYEPVNYLAGIGMIVGDLTLALGLESDHVEMSFPIGELITRQNLISRRFGMADCYVFDVDWTQPEPDPMEIMAGYIADARAEKNMAVFEIRSDADRWNTTIGRLAAPRCTFDFGDSNCRATVTVYETSVIEAISNMRFRVDLPGNYTDDFFRFGTVEFMSGTLDGTWPYEVVAFDGYLQEVEVLAPMPGFPQVGDSVLLRNGCSRVKKATDPAIPTCLTHDNVLRFGGLDQIPGTDRFIRMPIPKG